MLQPPGAVGGESGDDPWCSMSFSIFRGRLRIPKLENVKVDIH